MRSDVVLGMGRVVLEGLACNKPTILIGYEQVIGLVTMKRFSNYQQTNFSGRDQTPVGHIKTIKETIDAINSDSHSSPELIASVDINDSWPKLSQVLTRAQEQGPVTDLPVDIDSLISTAENDDEEFNEQLLALLSEPEKITFAKLKSIDI